MIPTVAQQISAIRHTIAKTVMPALDPAAAFAQEQAGLVLASLDWLLDTEASEHRYEQIDREDQRAVLMDLVAVSSGSENAAGSSVSGKAGRVLADTAVAAPDLLGLRQQNHELAVAIEELFDEVTATDGENADRATVILASAARRQGERERAWCRMTGFTSSADISTVLESQSRR